MRIKVLPILLLLIFATAAFAACGDDDDDSGAASATAREEAAMKKKEEAAMEKEEAAMKKDDAAAKQDDAMKDEGTGAATTVEVGDSEFGPMLFDSDDQAIYIFENDSRNKTVCYGQCAADWPPVFTSGQPRAGQGVDDSLLGTVKRRDGRLQVTYAGQPLYYYHDEGPGEVGCHNVNLNGGFWWVVGPDGERRA